MEYKDTCALFLPRAPSHCWSTVGLVQDRSLPSSTEISPSRPFYRGLLSHLSVSMDAIESKVEALANTILKTDAESWEIRNKAILQLGDIVMSFKDESEETINEHFTANVFRTLKEPVKNMVMVVEKFLHGLIAILPLPHRSPDFGSEVATSAGYMSVPDQVVRCYGGSYETFPEGLVFNRAGGSENTTQSYEWLY